MSLSAPAPLRMPPGGPRWRCSLAMTTALVLTLLTIGVVAEGDPDPCPMPPLLVGDCGGHWWLGASHIALDLFVDVRGPLRSSGAPPRVQAGADSIFTQVFQRWWWFAAVCVLCVRALLVGSKRISASPPPRPPTPRQSHDWLYMDAASGKFPSDVGNYDVCVLNPATIYCHAQVSVNGVSLHRHYRCFFFGLQLPIATTHARA
jgi:hypothetical protein